MSMSSEPKATIKIPRALYRRLHALIDGSGFDSVTDFVVYVLRDIAANTPLENTSEDSSRPVTDSGLTTDEVKNVRKRLKQLGYL